MGTIGIYGGGFKPPTKGHFAVAYEACKKHPEMDLLRIYVGGKDSLEQYLTALLDNDTEGKFKSTFSKEFNFSSEEIEQMFNSALQQSS